MSFTSQKLEPLSPFHRFIVVLSAKTTELLQFTNPLLSLKIPVSMAGLFCCIYFNITPPGRLRIFWVLAFQIITTGQILLLKHTSKILDGLNDVSITAWRTFYPPWTMVRGLVPDFYWVKMFDWKQIVFLLFCAREGKYLAGREKTRLCCPL